MRRWYHYWCPKCGFDAYFSEIVESNNGLVSVEMCSCGEPILGGQYHEDELGIGRMVFIKEGE